MKTLKNIYVKKKKIENRKKENLTVSISETPKPNGKNEGKKEIRKEKKGRGETEKMRGERLREYTVTLPPTP